MTRHERLIILTRPPIPGQVKTRLIPALGPAGAAQVHRRLAEGVLAWGLKLARSRPVRVEVRHDGGTTEEMRAWLGLAPLYRPQVAGDLGQRMAQALEQALDEGAAAAILVGTDLPGLTDQRLAQALDALRENDLVLGPATDGGYYLVGLTRPAPEIFTGLEWGGPKVLEQTLAAARATGRAPALLPELADVDRPEDISLLEQTPAPPSTTRQPGLISVIIPALNEEPNLGYALEGVLREQGVEILVVDGGSQDRTYELARELGAEVAASFPGRARQMNLGAGLARGEYLLFLHADTLPPPGWKDQVISLLGLPGLAMGAFRFGLDARGAAYRLLERLVNWRSRWLRMPYGDQGIFLRAELFEKLGGYREIPIMEDFDLIRRAARHGRIGLAPGAVRTSARRWRALGLLRTTLINQLIVLGYALGVPPRLLRRWYGRGLSRPS